MKKLLSILLSSVFVCLSISLVGCGKEKVDESKTVVIVYESDKASYYNDLKQGFEEKYSAEGYKLQLVPVGGGQVTDKQTTMIAQRTAPDIILGGDVHIGNQNKYLYDLNQLIERDKEEVDIDDFIPQIMNELRMDGKTLYLPEFFNVSLLYYNIDIFDEYNANPKNAENLVSYPTTDWTYDDFYSTAEKLTVRSGNQISKFGCYSTNGWWGEWLIHVRQAGGEFMNEAGYVNLDTPEAREGIKRYYDKMYSDNRISNQVALDDTFGDFSAGNFAMSYGGHISNWSDFKSTSMKWDVQLLPTVNGNRSGGELAINAFGIYKGTKALEASWAFLKYLTRKRSDEEWLAYPYPPCRTSGKNAVLSVDMEERSYPKNIEVAYLSLENEYCKSLPSQKYFSYVNTAIVQNYITKIMEGEYTIEAGLKEATTRANSYIRENYM